MSNTINNVPSINGPLSTPNAQPANSPSPKCLTECPKCGADLTAVASETPVPAPVPPAEKKGLFGLGFLGFGGRRRTGRRAPKRRSTTRRTHKRRSTTRRAGHRK